MFFFRSSETVGKLLEKTLFECHPYFLATFNHKFVVNEEYMNDVLTTSLHILRLDLRF